MNHSQAVAPNTCGYTNAHASAHTCAQANSRDICLVLASQSPRRRELLQKAGYTVFCMPAHIDEARHDDEAPEALVKRLSREKLLHVRAHFESLRQGSTWREMGVEGQTADNFFLAADTIVWTDAGEVLGKPRDEADAYRKLAQLSGTKHHVSTAVFMSYRGIDHQLIETTDVWFFPLHDTQINAYIQTHEPMDKAGAYGIQGGAALFVEKISGNYENVVGLPLAQTVRAIEDLYRQGQSASTRKSLEKTNR